MGRIVDREPEISFWLQYEKKKMQECAGTLHNLASAFMKDEKVEELSEDKERQNLFLKRRLKENRNLVADHLKEMASIMEKSAKEEIKIIRLSEKKEKQMAKLLYQEGLVLEDFFIMEKENGRKEAVVRLYHNKRHGKSKYYSTEEVAAFLSVILNMRLIPTIKTSFFITDKPDNFRFEEDTGYMVKVKATGEVTPASLEVVRFLWAEDISDRRDNKDDSFFGRISLDESNEDGSAIIESISIGGARDVEDVVIW